MSKKLKEHGLKLQFFKGDSVEILSKLTKEKEFSAVYWNRRYTPSGLETDKIIKKTLKDQNNHVQSFKANMLTEPWEVLKSDETPYRVFTAYWKSLVSRDIIKTPIQMRAFAKFQNTKSVTLPSTAATSKVSLKELDLLPQIPWDKGIQKAWSPGQDEAKKQLKKFASQCIESYKSGRDIPSLQSTSRLSPHLHFGEVSPKQVWQTVIKKFGDVQNIKDTNIIQYLKEIVWREFSYYLLFHFPKIHNKALVERFEKFPWRRNEKHLQRWQKGQTGYPIVDAGMRELWTTGWMHNRVRMIVASFLVKHLLIPWQDGAEWFWDTLVDADLASNTQGWQWTAGCGADAAPFFRIFNPMTQGKKFDPDGIYVKRWIPELNEIPKKYIHEPWEADEETLTNAKVNLGVDYPKPIVNHFAARQKALAAFETLKSLH